MSEIILSDGSVTQVSDEDLDYLNQWLWSPGHRGRPHRDLGQDKRKSMQHEVAGRMGLIVTDELDHKDRDPRNNRRDNLRLATRSQNQANASLRVDSTSGYKGVCLHASRRWVAKIQVKRVRIHLGLFDSPEEAAKAYDRASRAYFGEFANTNFSE